MAPVASNGQATQQSSAEVVDTNKTAETRPTAEIANDRSTPNLVAVRLNVDLEDYPLLRDAAGEAPTNRPIHLTATLTEMFLRLPENCPPGPYTISIRNTGLNRTYLNSKARSSNGKFRTLNATLDLGKLEPGSYVLCVSPASQVPFCYEARVTSRPK
jgi:hypothetical protein